MTPAARIAAAIEILDKVLDGSPAEPALLGWSRASRFAGSGDRAAVRDLVFEALRRRDSLAAMGGGLSGRGVMLGMLRAEGRDPAEVFSGIRHAPQPLSEAEAASGLSARDAEAICDIPDWLWPEWSASLGEGARQVAREMQMRAPVWLRVNARKADPETARIMLRDDGIETLPDARLRYALRVTSGERKVSRAAAYRDGIVELQDLSPQLACASLTLRDGMSVLDYCAGGGGKALALLARADLRLDAHDAAPERMGDLPERARRAGVSLNIVPHGRLGSAYDLVVADVPCCGSGTWRRSPDAKWRLSRNRLAELRATQAEILRETAARVAPGGALAYMTCSLLDAENGAQIEAFLGAEPDFLEETRRRWTPLSGSDGFFLSVLQRRA
ncbi:RsmB/NOP family class I SAM-dependent RNA methyltransferase [Paracoccus sediminicola]|uniref:RsmB/NOP family class I SAM-dependent RNA methyltransferase n=1 Tax=Paracoccus sediminicola TaxID=3017783 RepID=UPI0022F0630E|nr:RsmB/NOP family class I SAM-dependent RNA methyltransferase [Paracoccus sediminicola]WBU55500.1 RsmB/NOP family class I SAM-dependent RNA methyltransferase [Paracoccus sediminicola]